MILTAEKAENHENYFIVIPLRFKYFLIVRRAKKAQGGDFWSPPHAGRLR